MVTRVNTQALIHGAARFLCVNFTACKLCPGQQKEGGNMKEKLKREEKGREEANGDEVSQGILSALSNHTSPQGAEKNKDLCTFCPEFQIVPSGPLVLALSPLLNDGASTVDSQQYKGWSN